MKKLILTVFTTLLLVFAFSSLSAHALDPKYETIQIGVAYGSTAKSQVTVASVCGFNAGYMSGSVYQTLNYGFGEVSLTITPYSSTAVSINGTVYDMTGGNYALLPANGAVNIDGTIYRGGVKIIPDSNGKLTVVNFVNLNDYIAGVVGKEMSSSWHIEALKAQAVCARSYAIRNWNKHSSRGFNLCGTQDCQAYLGISGEAESTVRASHETKDQVIMYGSSIAEALYSSSNGGSTAYSKNVWGNDVPYLTAAYDPYDAASNNSRSSWQVTLTKEQIKTKLSQKGIDIGDITDLRVTGADEYGRTFEVTICGTYGTHVLRNDQTRSFFNLYSQKYTITPNGGNATSGGRGLYACTSGGVQPVSSYAVIGVYGISENSGELFAKGAYSTVPYQPSTYSSTPSSFVINGSGWGHGLGMSQYGAKVMAEQGFGYADIIKFYYKGVYIA